MQRTTTKTPRHQEKQKKDGFCFCPSWCLGGEGFLSALNLEILIVTQLAVRVFAQALMASARSGMPGPERPAPSQCSPCGRAASSWTIWASCPGASRGKAPGQDSSRTWTGSPSSGSQRRNSSACAPCESGQALSSSDRGVPRSSPPNSHLLNKQPPSTHKVLDVPSLLVQSYSTLSHKMDRSLE